MLQKNTIFDWTNSVDTAFQKLESLLVKATKNSLKYFYRSLPITVQADASSKGLLKHFFNMGKPIAFTSKRFSDTEKQYANIECDLLAPVFACDNFIPTYMGKCS